MRDALELDDFPYFLANDPEEAPAQELNFDDDQVCFYAPEDFEL